MALTYPDICLWPHVTASAGGVAHVYDFGEALAAAVTAAEVLERVHLRRSGAIRTVAAGPAADFNTAVDAAAQLEADRIGSDALGVAMVGTSTFILTT